MADVLIGAKSLFLKHRRALKERPQLRDLILIAVHKACDVRDLEAARQLLVSAETALSDLAAFSEAGRRQALDVILAAHERLWMLRHDPASLAQIFKAS